MYVLGPAYFRGILALDLHSAPSSIYYHKAFCLDLPALFIPKVPFCEKQINR